ncbi:type III pantothenate kinase [Halolactibacillus halophilus]|nr:type III pantothenate kinase [Halolactibacillus halophilus]GEM02641.1 type III pantothenate kinase [Halolactibacillus halophilus]
MLLVIDVGNTNTVIGLLEGEKITNQWRIKTDRHKTEDEFGMMIDHLFRYHGLTFDLVTDVIISSVVPTMMYALEKMVATYFKKEAIVVGEYPIDSYLKMTYPNPKEIGADRIVNAVGAIESYGAPLIIIDFGTATTLCYIDETASYVGGAILPGIKLSLEALYEKAAKLPKVEINHPQHTIGQSTVEAMQSGLYFGYVGQVDAMVKRFKQEGSSEATVIATGGLSHLIADESETIDVVDPMLTLKGLRSIYDKVKQ